MTVVSAASARDGIRDGAIVIDVRSTRQFEVDAWPGSVSLPLERIAAGEVPSVALDSTIYLVCAVGGFSELAALYLREAGFTAASSVRGGLVALRALEAG
jgi:rhodanese-related sulfurtransferase